MKNRDKLLNRINAYSDVELGTFMYHHNISTNDENNVEDWSATDYTYWLTQESEQTANEMFESLGYKRYMYANNTVDYITDENVCIHIDQNKDLVSKFLTNQFDYTLGLGITKPITKEELKAINKHFQELGRDVF